MEIGNIIIVDAFVGGDTLKINQQIKNLRKDNDLTQKQVADALYMQVTQYRRYETGERTIPIDVAISLAKTYNVSLDYLAGLSLHNDNISSNNLSADEKMLLTNYRRLSEINQIRIVERIETLLSVQNENKK